MLAKFYGFIYFITSKYFFEICSSKRKYLDNLDFLNNLAVRIGLETLKADWQDCSGDV